MQVLFTKMQGAGNDFVVLDETRGCLGLSAAQYRFLADRHFGVGADQILSVRPSPAPGIDFEYLIHNADGGEVEQCGNGARCFARFVRDKGLTHKDSLRVQTRGGVIAPRLTPDGRVTVDMGCPRFDPADLPFDTSDLQAMPRGAAQQWPLALGAAASGTSVWIAIVAMGNPHAVQWVDDVDSAPVQQTGPLIANHARFAQRVNAGFMQIVDRGHARLRVFERGVGETLACGTGACAAAAAGIRLGLLDPEVHVDMRGGRLSISWSGAAADSVFMTGPAATVFEGRIELPPNP
ncbi:diaminopimelate epimerase [Verminephrobacter aporrectodeae subsp. tuberculatae]|uniref:diaminopimelate epimerase n=1 Tax=Verminephrobacter aporrectodeae TaxID=1110389 RepID=UPI0022380921|nr:diaminopimelate epimerase [Verminephrobacter aporrectodeae]MCW5221149.1 diaminopimelate epimerase [Verminephrobacter aporrectodeae subsp. tuberculatae]MCW5290440.1 diaminopimelate epimerase [Verminephrobacter aporrectodeae subsp. tuberculatae]